MNFRDITKFFRIRSSSAFLDLTNRGLNLIPGEYISEALSLILRADVFLNKQKITDKEQEELIYIIARIAPAADAEKLLDEAKENSRTLEKALACAEKLSAVSLENRVSFASLLLEFDKSYLPVREKTRQEFQRIAEKLSIREKKVEELLEKDAKRRQTASKVLNSGAGVAVALIVLLLFLLAATFLRSLFFGVLLAYLFLPVEKYFETRFFRSPAVVFLSRLMEKLFLPFTFLSRKVTKPKEKTREEYVKGERKALIMKSTFATFISLLVFLFLALILLAAIIIPTAMNIGRDLKGAIGSSETITKLEQQINDYVKEPEKNSSVKAPASPTVKEQDKAVRDNGTKNSRTKGKIRNLVQKLRPQLKKYAAKYKEELTKFAFDQSKGVVSLLFSIIKFLGQFLFDLLLMLFFFLYFLQQMAFFTNSLKGGKKKKSRKLESVGSWAVKGIFETPWLPSVDAESKNEAVKIIDNISNMFRCWARGYLTIILIESVLYVTLFSIISVPYGVVLGLISSTTVLLPVLGLAGCITLSCTVCLIFCEAHLGATLIGVLLVYLLVNGILEQLILYPNLVGGSIGLSILETIIVVLLGGLFAGIPGMIFAVPAAAVIKYLIPRIYNIWIKPSEGKKS